MGVFKCRLESCDFTVSRTELRDHHKTHGGSASLSHVLNCSFCSFTTTNRQKMTSHQKEHDVMRPFKCSYCEYSAKSQAILSSHINKRHGAVVTKATKVVLHSKDGKTSLGLSKKILKNKQRSEEHVDDLSAKEETKVVLSKSICKAK